MLWSHVKLPIFKCCWPSKMAISYGSAFYKIEASLLISDMFSWSLPRSPFIRAGGKRAHPESSQGLGRFADSCQTMSPALAGGKGQAVPREGTDLQLPFSALKPTTPPPPSTPWCLVHFSFPWFWSKNLQRAGHGASVVGPQPSDPAEGIPGRQDPEHTQASLFLSLAHSLPFFGSGICLLCKAGMSFWIVFICWRFGVKALSVSCILILSAVCIYFPLPPSPGLIYGFPSPCFLLSQWQSGLCGGYWGLGLERDLFLGRWATMWCDILQCVWRGRT